MADKVLTHFAPVSADIDNLHINFDGNGNVVSVEIAVLLRTNDPSEPRRRDNITVPVSVIPQARLTEIASLATAALTYYKNQKGY